MNGQSSRRVSNYSMADLKYECMFIPFLDLHDEFSERPCYEKGMLSNFSQEHEG